jgi:hypothetical protein
VLGLIARWCGFSIVRFLIHIREELLLVHGTSSSETALPLMIQKLRGLGCAPATVGLVVPTGYSFNLDGTNIYMTLAALFIAQAVGIDLPLGEQLLLLAVAMLSSKGAAGVTGAGFITLAATLSGHFGLAVIDARLGGGLAQTLQQLTPLLGPGAPLACLAFRAEVEQGTARVTTLFLDGAAGRVAGEGVIRLSDEALSMRLLTDLRVAGLRVRAPVPLTGRLLAPRL